MALPAGLDALMRGIPPLGGPRAAPGPTDLAAGGAAPGAVGAAPAPPTPTPSPAGPGAGGGGGDIFSQVVNSIQSKSAGADPQYFVEQLNQMKTVATSMLPKALMRFPAQTDKQLQNLLRAIDATIKVFQDAAMHQGAAGGAIDFAGASGGQPSGLPMPV